jgi:hypothetical protein
MGIDNEALAAMLQRFIRADRLSYDNQLREKTATLIIRQYRMDNIMDAPLLLKFSENFHKTLQQRYNLQNLESCVPFHYQKGEQFFKGNIDYLISASDKKIFIKDSLLSYEEFRKKMKKKLPEFSAVLRAAELSIRENSNNNFDAVYLLHFPLEAVMVELK